MKQELHHDGSDALYETVLKLQSTDECRAFFEDICSPHELRTIEQRFQLLFLLTSGRSYSEIGEITGASSATISRASRPDCQQSLRHRGDHPAAYQSGRLSFMVNAIGQYPLCIFFVLMQRGIAIKYIYPFKRCVPLSTASHRRSPS